MQIISLKSNSSEIMIPLLKNAINREKLILIESIRIAKEKISRLSESFSVDIEKLMAGKVEHTDANDMELIEIEGEVGIMKELEGELKELESLEICK